MTENNESEHLTIEVRLIGNYVNTTEGGRKVVTVMVMAGPYMDEVDLKMTDDAAKHLASLLLEAVE